jgi:hypothetical protein
MIQTSSHSVKAIEMADELHSLATKVDFVLVCAIIAYKNSVPTLLVLANQLHSRWHSPILSMIEVHINHYSKVEVMAM